MTLVEARACRRIIVDPTRPGTTIRGRVTAPDRVSWPAAAPGPGTRPSRPSRAPWSPRHRSRDRGRGRVETPSLKVATEPGLGFPHARQAVQTTRPRPRPPQPPRAHRGRLRGHRPDLHQASPAQLADLLGGHCRCPGSLRW